MFDRFKEGSSWAAFAATAGTTLPMFGIAQPIVVAVTGVLGFIAFLLKDKSK